MKGRLRGDWLSIADWSAGGAVLLLWLLLPMHGASACTLAMAPGFREPQGRVAAMALALRHGAVEAVRHLPPGWRLAIDNDPSWTTVVTAHAILGAAFLNAGGLPGAFSIQPEPGHGCGDVLRSGIALSLTLYRDDTFVRVRVRASALRMTR